MFTPTGFKVPKSSGPMLWALSDSGGGLLHGPLHGIY